ncbi:hypothetical protein ACC690_38490, partial [Rhizobium johnstonii]|uniref:hypothetical protein n=1 Tax=Rhizobium johnstonii TaxID=3019933 RepID=UPI003F970EB7
VRGRLRGTKAQSVNDGISIGSINLDSTLEGNFPLLDHLVEPARIRHKHMRGGDTIRTGDRRITDSWNEKPVSM